jgi:hypothetical protein
MGKVILSLHHKPESYVVMVKTYSDDGRLLSEEKYSSVKQVIIRSGEVRLSRQLSPQPLVIVVDAVKPRVELRENTLLYIIDEGVK